MQPLNLNDVVRFVEENIGGFHQRRANNLRELKLYGSPVINGKSRKDVLPSE